MTKTILITSLCTALFCAIFAGAVDDVTDALAWWYVTGFGAVSWFAGSFFGQKVAQR